MLVLKKEISLVMVVQRVTSELPMTAEIDQMRFE